MKKPSSERTYQPGC